MCIILYLEDKINGFSSLCFKALPFLNLLRLCYNYVKWIELMERGFYVKFFV